MSASDIDWTDPKFLDAINASLAATAKCRGAFKAISQNLGATTVIVPSIAPGSPLAYGPDQVESAVQVYVDLNVDEQQHAGDLPTVINLISTGAAALGALEDRAIVEGVSAVAAGAPVIVGRGLRQRAIPHGSLSPRQGGPVTQIPAREGRTPDHPAIPRPAAYRGHPAARSGRASAGHHGAAGA